MEVLELAKEILTVFVTCSGTIIYYEPLLVLSRSGLLTYLSLMG